MRQLLFFPSSGELCLAELPPPAAQQNGCLIKTVASFISAGTERMLVDCENPASWKARFKGVPRKISRIIEVLQDDGLVEVYSKVVSRIGADDAPVSSLPMGYSCAGVVAAVGRNTQDFAQGDRVACCGVGYANHAEFNYLPKNLIVKIPDKVSFNDASTAAVGGIALQAVRRCEAKVGEVVAVVGMGIIGLLAAQILKAAGCIVIGYDPDDARSRLAGKLGADRTCSADLERVSEDMTREQGVDAVLIAAATASNQPLVLAGRICRRKGKVVVAGLVGMDLPRADYYRKELDLLLSTSYGAGRYDPEYEEFGHDYPYGYVRWTEQRNLESYLQLIADGKLTPSEIITHQFDFDHALDAYRSLKGEALEDYLGIVLEYAGNQAGSEDISTSRSTMQGLLSINGDANEATEELTLRTQEIVAGLIGCGTHCTGILLPCLNEMQGVEVSTICNQTGKSGWEAASRFGISSVTTAPEEIFADDKINTVFISTRHDSHSHYVCEALTARKHVFVEKPLAITEEELIKIIEIYNGLDEKPVLYTGFNRRFSPHALLAKRYIVDRTSPLVMNYRVNAGRLPKDHWTKKPEVGGGRIIGEVCHSIDFASFMTDGFPVAVTASSLAAGKHVASGEDNLAIIVEMDDGSLINILYVANGAKQVAKERCEIFVNESTVILDDYEKTSCRGKLGTAGLKGEQEKGFREELAEFTSSIRAGRGAAISVSSQLITTATSFAIIDSMRSRKRVIIQNIRVG